MVSQDPVPERKKEQEYSLEAVRRAAGFRQVIYASRRVQKHVGELGFGLDDVCDHIACLLPENFAHSERYPDDRRWHDVYLLPHYSPTNPRERIYIKFRLDRDCVFLDLCSFHPEGWL